MQGQSKAARTESKGLLHSNGMKLMQEMYGGEPYEYYPLGKYIVAAPGVCGGRPTFKYTRLETSMILSLLVAGDSIEELVQAYSESHLTREAVREALRLANQAFLQSTKNLQTG
jgi:uncharacterized protein (DUF433 family)